MRSGSLSPRCGVSSEEGGRGRRMSAPASLISTSVLLGSVFRPLGTEPDATSTSAVETCRSGVDLAGSFLFCVRFSMLLVFIAGVVTEAGEALDTGVGGAAVGAVDCGCDAARASASER